MEKQLTVLFCICLLDSHFAFSQNSLTPFAAGFDIVSDAIVDGKIDAISSLIDKDYSGHFAIAPYEQEFIDTKIV